MKALPAPGLSPLLSALSLVLFVLPSQDALGDSIVPAPGVTLELCGDVDVDEVSSALAIEYFGEDFERTMVTVACEGDSARVRVIGPSHPRGRIVDIDLTGVDEVAKPRTLAMVAAEIWTAPEAPGTSSQEMPIDEVLESTKQPLLRRYRSSPSAGLSVLAANRETFAGRSSGRYGYRDELTMFTVKVDWPLWSHLGVFLSYGEGTSNNLDTHDASGIGIAWERSEFGFYVPVWRERLRLDIRFAAGEDALRAYGNVRMIDSNVLLPDYNFSSVGVDAAYALNDKIDVLGWAGYYSADMWDFDYRSPFGTRRGLGLAYALREHVQLDLRAEILSLRDSSIETGRSYTDDLATLELGLSFVR